jgi:hypothetical protein
LNEASPEFATSAMTFGKLQLDTMAVATGGDRLVPALILLPLAWA